MSGFCWIPLRNEVDRAAIRMEPASAVPIEAPRFVAVFCRPPTSGLCSSGTADTVTAPSWEASAPMPRPVSSSGTVTIAAEALAFRLACSDTIPASMASRPSRTIRRGDTFGRKRGIPAAASSSVIDSGRILAPVSSADRPSEIDRPGCRSARRPWPIEPS